MEDEYDAPPPEDWPSDDGDRSPPETSGEPGGKAPGLGIRMPLRAAAARGVVPSPADLLDAGSRRALGKPERPQHELVARPEANPAAAFLFPTVPRARKRRSYLARISFALMVVVPLSVAAVYYGLIAAPQYVSTFHFSVRSASSTAPPPMSSTTSSITTQLSGSLGGSPSGADMLSNYVVVDYVTSAQAIQDIAKKLPLRSYFAAKSADWWARLSPTASKEDVKKYWDRMVSASYDPATGLAEVTVRAFSPEAAHAIAVALSASAEKLVNRMEARARDDSVRFAQEMVDRDQKRLRTVEEKLLKLRQKSGVIDPTTSVVADNAQIVRQLETTLTGLETQYAATAAQAPQAPGLASLREQIKATRDQLAATRAKIGTTVTGTVLPSMVGAFESATLEEQFIQQALNNDLAALQMAQMSAVSQALYLMEEVPPTLPQSATYPRRLLDVVLIGLACLGIWVTAALLLQAIRSRLA